MSIHDPEFNQLIREIYSRSAPEQVLDRALGAVYGSLCGDAAGAVLEFLGRKPTPEEVDCALTMPGGGCWDVAPGQITDDGELTMSLLHAMAEMEGNVDFDIIATWYRKWLDSKPFDIGFTTNNGLSAVATEELTLSEAMWAKASRKKSSQANGSLMRATPWMIFYPAMVQDVMTDAPLESALTHGNELVCDAVSFYVAVGFLLVNGHTAEQAIGATLSFFDQFKMSPEVRNDWFGNVIREGHNPPPFHPNAGWAKIGFSHAMKHVLESESWEDSIKTVLLGGGDTDTNAAIVGGLMGAKLGFSAIPETVREAVLSCDTSKGRSRPEWLHPKLAQDLIRKIRNVT